MAELGSGHILRINPLKKTLHLASVDTLVAKLQELEIDRIAAGIEDLVNPFFFSIQTKDKLSQILKEMHEASLNDPMMSYKVAKFLGKVVDGPRIDGMSLRCELFLLLQTDFYERKNYELTDRTKYLHSIIFLAEVVDAIKMMGSPTTAILVKNLLVHLHELLKDLESDALQIFLHVLIVNRKTLQATSFSEIQTLYATIRRILLDSQKKLPPRCDQMLCLAVDLTAANCTMPISPTRDIYLQLLGHRFKALEDRANRQFLIARTVSNSFSKQDTRKFMENRDTGDTVRKQSVSEARSVLAFSTKPFEDRVSSRPSNEFATSNPFWKQDCTKLFENLTAGDSFWEKHSKNLEDIETVCNAWWKEVAKKYFDENKEDSNNLQNQNQTTNNPFSNQLTIQLPEDEAVDFTATIDNSKDGTEKLIMGSKKVEVKDGRLSVKKYIWALPRRPQQARGVTFQGPSDEESTTGDSKAPSPHDDNSD